MIQIYDIVNHVRVHGLEGGRFIGEFIDKKTGNNLATVLNSSTGLVSNPPAGMKKILNIYYDPNTGSIAVDVEP